MATTIRVEAENYKSGEQGVAYYDTTLNNEGDQYRSDTVDIYANNQASGGLFVGATQDGEWLTYTVNVATTGLYNLVARVASGRNTSMSLGLSVDGGQQKTLPFSGSGGSMNWTGLQYGAVNLSAGEHTLRLDILKGGFNFDYIELLPTTSSTSSPSSGSSSTPTSTTQTIRVEAENYNSGEQGVAYYDTTSNNAGGKYRSDTVDIYGNDKASKGYFIGSTENGEWLTYNVNIATTGAYNIVARVASGRNTSMSLGLSVDGGQQKTLPFSGSGGSMNWTGLDYGTVNLSAGKHTLRLDILQGGFNLDYIELIPTSSSPTSPVSPTYNLGNVINGSTGSKTYAGGDGIDTINYSQATSAIVANLGTGVVTHKFATSPENPTKILPVGDSITFGLEKTNDLGSYRDDLWQLMTDNNFNIDFVGPQSTGPANFSDNQHAGFGGQEISFISQNINNWLSTYQPDKVLLMIGTNDIMHKNNVREAPYRLNNLIDQITERAPNTQLFVASIAPIFKKDPLGQVDFRQQGIDFNSKIPGIIKSKAEQGKNVSFVDVYSVLTASDLVDGVHPGLKANEKIGKVWYDAILKSNSGTDTLNKIENIVGSQYNDNLTGSSGDNILNGGKGYDTLTGGDGRDIFVLASGQGTDTITDFTIGKDFIGLSNGLKFDQLIFTQGNGTNVNDTWISYNNQQLAVLNGVQANTITSNSFISV